MRLRHLDRISAVPAARWDALFPGGYPFTRHAYLQALEDSGSVTAARGWTPCHLVLEQDDGLLLAAAPLYLKAHSWGEFVFDFAWAEGAARGGLRYYPKLLTAIPFTPATGPRFGAADDASRQRLLTALRALPDADGASSWHALFLSAGDAEPLRSTGSLLRHDVQFHWHNRQDATGLYRDFDDFLSALHGEKRKKIQQERRKVAALGLHFSTAPGHAYDADEWHQLYALYANTYEERGQPPYLTPAFFLDFARRADSPFHVTVAREGPRIIAMALLVQGGDTLYGRHWGTAVARDGLHFETCYYQGIDYCIRLGLSRYDAGAQGEHKLARGFDPVMTHSLHHFADPRLGDAVARALARERQLVQLRFAELQARSAYKTAARTA